jgi:superfamily II DNA/RNA helicase
MDKIEMLARLLQARDRGLVMVFCRTKRTCDRVAEQLVERGFAAAAVHGDLGQGAREQALRAFRSGKIDVLVATDVAARGIDVSGVTHVVNYQCPEDETVYLHRIGRTGRAGENGVAVTFVDWDDVPRWNLINRALGLPFADPAETYSTSEHFYDALDIPAGVRGVLPREARSRAGLAAEAVEDIGETGRSRAAARPDRSRSNDAARPAGATRTRRRTRGGAAEAGASPRSQTGSVAPDRAESPARAESGTGEGGSGEGGSGEGATRRRRRRGGRGRTHGGSGGSGGSGAGVPDAESA